MRNNFWKWLKRFFVIVPIVMMLLQIVFSMGSYWRDNATNNFFIGDDDYIQIFVQNGFEGGNNIINPLLITPSNSGNVFSTIQRSFFGLYGILTGSSLDSVISHMQIEPYLNAYEFIMINFLTWWVFVELVFLFFRFVTFLISWVNSLFDNTFKKIKK